MLIVQRLFKGLPLHLIRRATTSVINEAKSDQQEDANLLKRSKNKSMVAAAFEALKDESISNINIPASEHTGIDEKIINAKTVNGLLAVTETSGPISRRHALKVVSILAEWSSINRAKLSEFENDSRFIKVCRVLGRTLPKNGPNGNNSNNNNNFNQNKKIAGFRTDDLNTVLGVAGDDEAAKLIASISLPQMVKVMTTLAQRKRRSTPLLRSLAFNISSNSEPLDLKQCADILFAMAILNFPDSVLTAKICSDIQITLSKNSDKSAVVGSILTSLGFLKYRDLDVLESLCNWLLKNSDISRSQDLSALFLTLSTLNYKSNNMENIETKLINGIVKQDFNKPQDWLNHVWALTLLRFVNAEQVESVLSEEFLKQLEEKRSGLIPTVKMKLLNINAYAKLMMDSYSGALLSPNSNVYSVPIAHNKSKQILLNGMLDSLKSLFTSQSLVKSLVDSQMGFLIDAECAFDSKLNPLSLDKEHSNAKRIAIMVIDFHDMCHGPHRSLSGLTKFNFDLLEKCGYNVVPVPYTEFSTTDKLLKRVQYLEAKFKEIVNTKT